MYYIFFLIFYKYYFNIYVTYSNSKALLNKNSISSHIYLFWFCFFHFLCSFLYHFLLFLMISCSKKKMCFIYRAQLMEVLLYLLAGNYVSLSNPLCVVNMTACACAVAWHVGWNQMPRGQYAIPSVVYCLHLFVANGSLGLFLICVSLSSPFKKTALRCCPAHWGFNNGSKSGAKIKVALVSVHFYLATMILLPLSAESVSFLKSWLPLHSCSESSYIIQSSLLATVNETSFLEKEKSIKINLSSEFKAHLTF